MLINLVTFQTTLHKIMSPLKSSSYIVYHTVYVFLQLKTLRHIGNLMQLRSLNISKCANVKDITELHKCSSLQSLNLSGLKLSPDAFSILEGSQSV